MKEEKREVKYEKPDKKELKKEAPIQQYDSAKEEIKQEKSETTRYNRGILTSHKNYNQIRPVTAVYMMLDPRTMYVHNDSGLAMKNYVSMSQNMFNNCKGNKRAA